MDILRRLAGLALLLTAAVFPLGCGSDTDQSSPESTVRSFFDAMMEGDTDAVGACITGDEKVKRAVMGMAEYMAAMQDFRDAVIAEWGEEGWSHFTESGGAKLSIEDERDKIDRMETRVEGDRAYCALPGESDELVLVRKDGKWYVDAGQLASGFTGAASQSTELFSRMADMLREKQKRIGEEGITAESLDEELGRDMMKAMMGQ
jgi:hypothetical protein